VSPLRILREAETELGAAAEWYEARRAGLGVELVAAIDAAFEEIVTTPLASPTWRDDRPFRKVPRRGWVESSLLTSPRSTRTANGFALFCNEGSDDGDSPFRLIAVEALMTHAQMSGDEVEGRRAERRALA
jgi:hypothetical protein